jgi:hypothetical protein
MMIKKLNKVPCILERGEKKKRLPVLIRPPAGALPMRSLQITKAIE